MCYNCGCHIPDDDMGHPDNITTETFKNFGERNGKTEGQSRQWVYLYLEKQYEDPSAQINPDIEEIFLKASRAWGQSIEEAKKQTYNMLKSEL